MYFLNPDPTSGALDIFYASVGALYQTQHGVWGLWSDDVATAFYQALAAAAEFAIKQGDDWVAVVKGYEYDERQTRFAEIRAILVTRGVIPAWTDQSTVPGPVPAPLVPRQGLEMLPSHLFRDNLGKPPDLPRLRHS